MDEKKHILLVEDSESLAVVYKGYLAKEDHRVTHTEMGNDAIELIKQHKFDAILLDLELPDINGLEVMSFINSSDKKDVPVIVITAHGSLENVVSAMRLGAFDFLAKPFNSDRLKVTLRNALEHSQLTTMVNSYKETYEKNRFHSFVGSSMAMQAVYRIIESAAHSSATVFIQGESGTGKELCAEAVHQESSRKEKPFVAINCAAIPKDLIESELFGHVKGAFTGANKDRQGAASKANGGTLFLDEICEMNFDLQSKLLRFLQTGTYYKVGSDIQEKVNLRIICATNKDPLQEVQQGRFREDLYYRLHVIPIELPPLRERDKDILDIANYFLDLYATEEGKNFSGFDKEAEKILTEYHWPGNIRELQNIIRNIVVLNNDRYVTAWHFPPQVKNHHNSSMSNIVSLSTAAKHYAQQGDSQVLRIRPLWIIEKEAIEYAIELCNGNVSKAAALLDISPSTIYRKIQSWEGRDRKV